MTKLKTMKFVLISLLLLALNVTSNEFADKYSFEKLKEDLLFYLSKSDEFHSACNEISNELRLESSFITDIFFNVYSVNYYIHPSSLKKCMELVEPPLGFLNKDEGNLLYDSTLGFNKGNLNWVFRLKIQYYRITNRLCNIKTRSLYDPEMDKNYIVNICGHKRYQKNKPLTGRLN